MRVACYSLSLLLIRRGFMKRTTAAYVLTLALAVASWSAHAKNHTEWQAMTSNLQVNLEQAAQQATDLVPGTVIDIELDDGDGAGVRYEAQVISPTGNSMEVWVDAATGKARLHENEGLSKVKDQQHADAVQISLKDAVRSALKFTPGIAVKAEVGNHWGTLVYKVDVLQADHTVIEVKLDAADGQVIGAKRD